MTRATYDIDRLAEDMVLRGWVPAELARRASVSKMTTTRLFRDGTATAPTIAKLAKALGYSIRRYYIAPTRRAA